MAVIKGIISFPALFTPKTAKGANEAKFSCAILIAPNDPQIATLEAEVAQAKANTFPSGYTGTNECFQPYDKKYAGKDYHDPRFSGWYVFSCTAKATDKPAVVDANRNPIMDPSQIFSGAVVYLNAGLSGYTAGTGGIGGWLNGVMLTDEVSAMGRLDNKPSVDQMFASVGGAATPAAVAAPVAAAPLAPAAPATPVAPAALIMTAAAAGVTYEQYMATAGWTDELLIAQGLAIKPSFA